MTTQQILQKIKDGTFIDTVEPKKMSEVDKLVRDCKMIEVTAVIEAYKREAK
jgi:hypothetical protein